jgi:hypothetical protein
MGPTAKPWGVAGGGPDASSATIAQAARNQTGGGRQYNPAAEPVNDNKSKKISSPPSPAAVEYAAVSTRRMRCVRGFTSRSDYRRAARSGAKHSMRMAPHRPQSQKTRQSNEPKQGHGATFSPAVAPAGTAPNFSGEWRQTPLEASKSAPRSKRDMPMAPHSPPAQRPRSARRVGPPRKNGRLREISPSHACCDRMAHSHCSEWRAHS